MEPRYQEASRSARLLSVTGGPSNEDSSMASEINGVEEGSCQKEGRRRICRSWERGQCFEGSVSTIPDSLRPPLELLDSEGNVLLGCDCWSKEKTLKLHVAFEIEVHNGHLSALR
jgi:hypothetical protein